MKTKKYTEDAPTNATGSAVVGTGDDVADWKPKKKKKKKVLKRLKGTYEVGRMPDPELTLEDVSKWKKDSEKDMIQLRLKGVSERDVIKWRTTFYKLTTKALKMMPGSPAQKKIIKQIETLRKKLKMDEGLMERDYRKEYDSYHAKPEQRERNAARLRARRLMVKKGKAVKHDKKDVHHKDNNPLNNDTNNLSVVTQKYNRTEPRLRDEDIDATPTPEVAPDSVFAQMPVFKVSQDDFAKCKDVKKRYERWSRHIDTESEYGKKIHTYAKKNPKKSIIVQDDTSGHMVYLKKYSQVEKDK